MVLPVSSSEAVTPVPASKVLALVLAAGSGRRFGADKRRALMADGMPLLAATLAQAQRNFAQVAVVLRPADDPRQLGVPAGVQVIYCTTAEQGMGHSLAAGIAALHGQPASAIAILLGDMPWVRSATLQALSAPAAAQRMVFPLHAGERGHPVLFGRDFWAPLQALSGDAGAKALLAAHPDAWLGVAVDDLGVLRDVDTPAALV